MGRIWPTVLWKLSCLGGLQCGMCGPRRLKLEGEKSILAPAVLLVICLSNACPLFSASLSKRKLSESLKATSLCRKFCSLYCQQFTMFLETLTAYLPGAEVWGVAGCIPAALLPRAAALAGGWWDQLAHRARNLGKPEGYSAYLC